MLGGMTAASHAFPAKVASECVARCLPAYLPGNARVPRVEMRVAWKSLEREKNRGGKKKIKIKNTGRKIKGRRKEMEKSRRERIRGNTRFERGEENSGSRRGNRGRRNGGTLELALGRKAGINRGRKREREREAVTMRRVILSRR